MKNVLIITFYFPPHPGIGAVRPFGLAKYLSLYGWNPIILTHQLPGNPDPKFVLIQTPYKDVVERWKTRFGLNPKKPLNTQLQIKRKKDKPSVIDRLAFIPNEIITYPDEKFGWYDYALFEGERILQTYHVDAILSSSRPETCHLVAKDLARKYHIPWVADFRDLWSQNHYSTYSRLKKYFIKSLEIRTLKYASAITTVSQPLAEKLAELHQSKPVFTIKNGFDPEMMSKETETDQYFSIVYTGDLYEGKRDPAQLFAVIQELCDSDLVKRDEIRIHFFGYPRFEAENWLQEEITKYHLDDVVILHGTVSHETAISQQRKAQMLLLLMWNNPEDRGVYTGKLFEYLAARRPVISYGFPEGGVIKELLHQTHAGIHAGSYEELKAAIIQSYQEFRTSGKVQYRGIHEAVMLYSQQEMAKNFAGLLDGMLQKKDNEK